MDSPQEQPAAGAGDWLSPSAALAQFEPAEGVNMAAQSQVREEKRTRYGFRIGELGLLINPDSGSEVLAKPPIAPMPGAPQGFLGLINLRGNLVPVYELQQLLGIAVQRADAHALVLVFGQGEQAVGVIVGDFPTALLELRRLPNLPPLPGALQEHVSAGYVQDDRIWLEFDHSAFFAEASRGMRVTMTGS